MNSRNFDYVIRQNGGNSNALGIIKFIFQNKYSVYFHDTQSKDKFNKDIRAYSHGCIRIHEPLRLAEYLLNREDEKFSIDVVKKAIRQKQQKSIHLENHLPVHIRYFTAEANEEGNLIVYPDVYGREKELKKIMFGEEII